MTNDLSTGPRPSMTTADIDAGLATLHALCNDPTSPVQTPVDGFTCAELADIVGCSEAAIRRRISAALIKLRINLPADIHPNT